MEQKKEPEPKDKDAENERPKPPPGFRKFRKMLKRVVNAPPMKSHISIPLEAVQEDCRDRSSDDQS
jgi:hypothetical protein